MKCRLFSRVIGFFDLVLAIIGIIVGLGICLYGISEFHGLGDRAVGIFIFLMVIVCIVGAVQIYSSHSLIKGTKKGVSPQDGLKLCLVWRRVNIVFLILMFFSLLQGLTTRRASHEASSSLWGIGLRVLALVIVQQYIKDLKLQMAAPVVKVTNLV